VIAALLSGLTRPLLIAAGIAAALLALWLWLETHDAHIRADERSRWQAAADRAIADARTGDQARINAAWEAERQAADLRADFNARLRKAIYASPQTTACAAAPAIRAVLDGMRPAGGGAGASAGRAGGAAVLPSAAGSPARKS